MNDYTAGPTRKTAETDSRIGKYTMEYNGATWRRADGMCFGSHAENSTGLRGCFSRLFLALLLIGGALAAGIPSASGHEIPTDVVIRSFVKPADDRVEVLLRVPLEAMRDVEVPLRGPGYIDLAAVEPYLRDAGEIWLANFFADSSSP